MKPCIWLMLDSRNSGGIESHVGQLAKGLDTRGYDIWVVFWQLYRAEHPLRSELQQHGIKTLVLGGSVWRYLRAVRKCKPAIIHTHGYKSGLISRVFGWFINAELVASFHAGETPKGRVWWYDWLDRQSAHWCQTRIAVSQQIARRLKCQVTVIDNFVELPKTASHVTADKSTIAFVGRLAHEKAPERILQMARCLPEQSFDIYGDGPLRAELVANAPNNVHFHGDIANMQAHWPHIGLLLLPSHAEGLPMVALEAMASGCSVIATPVGALPELLRQVHGCQLIEGDNIELWCQAIIQWQQRDVTQQQCDAAASIARVEQQYSSDAIVPKFEAIYANAIYPNATNA
ncbi:glycosyltransferase family 4 protein [Neiella holothuriorum]|nr:glycosyltransferase family 4 protein [Neiella holothuriorum]